MSAILSPNPTQPTDWPKHQKYCKHLAYVRDADLERTRGTELVADARGSQVYKDAYTAAKAKAQTMSEDDARQELCYVLLTVKTAQNFAKALHDDMLPSSEIEEHIWGLYGQPRSPGYQRLLVAYQKAFKYGDLTATKLMEALCARPNTSKALTDLLHNTKIIATQTDTYDSCKAVADVYLGLIEGLEVVSEFDKWPIRDAGQS